MVLKVQPTLGNETIARTRADMLMTFGAELAVRALANSALAHKRQAALAANHELMEHWDAVIDILHEAETKLGALT